MQKAKIVLPIRLRVESPLIEKNGIIFRRLRLFDPRALRGQSVSLDRADRYAAR